MAPRKKPVQPPTAPTSSLPEKFEVFAASMTAGDGMAKPRPIGGMVEKRWSGMPMWECPRCAGTTFSEADAKTHTCKEVRFADEEFAE